MKINSIIDLVKDLDTSRQTKNLNKLLIRILLHLQVEFSDDERKKWLDASQEDGILWINTSEQKSFRDNQIAKDYKVTQIPALFVIDPSGKIVKQNPDIDYLLNLTTK